MKPKQQWGEPSVVVKPGTKIELKNIDPAAVPPVGKDDAKAICAENARAIDELQDRLYAEGRRALLIVLQGTDCSGKDGTIRAVFNTQQPTSTILDLAWVPA